MAQDIATTFGCRDFVLSLLFYLILPCVVPTWLKSSAHLKRFPHVRIEKGATGMLVRKDLAKPVRIQEGSRGLIHSIVVHEDLQRPVMLLDCVMLRRTRIYAREQLTRPVQT